jgi:hypothetical protein
VALKVALATLAVADYTAFLWFSGQKPRYLQEDPRLLGWCLATQAAGFLLVVGITTIGTMLVYYRDVLPVMGL